MIGPDSPAISKAALLVCREGDLLVLQPTMRQLWPDFPRADGTHVAHRMAMAHQDPEHTADGRAESPDVVRLVLLTESDKQLENPYRRPLEQAGYTVLVVPSGDAPAVSKKFQPALIILQLAEPATAGLFLVRELRTQAETRGTPVITLMRFDDAHTREQIVRAGATAILIDPVKIPMLLRQMRRLLVRALASAHAGAAEGLPVTASAEAARV